jgi:hypothetical protein
MWARKALGPFGFVAKKRRRADCNEIGLEKYIRPK